VRRRAFLAGAVDASAPALEFMTVIT